jgi:hypothetical protein
MRKTKVRWGKQVRKVVTKGRNWGEALGRHRRRGLFPKPTKSWYSYTYPLFVGCLGTKLRWWWWQWKRTKTETHIYVKFLNSWRRRHCVPPKCYAIFNGLQGVIPHKTKPISTLQRSHKPITGIYSEPNESNYPPPRLRSTRSSK